MCALKIGASISPNREVSPNQRYLFGVPTVKIIIYWGLYWGSAIVGDYHMEVAKEEPTVPEQKGSYSFRKQMWA